MIIAPLALILVSGAGCHSNRMPLGWPDAKIKPPSGSATKRVYSMPGWWLILFDSQMTWEEVRRDLEGKLETEHYALVRGHAITGIPEGELGKSYLSPDGLLEVTLRARSAMENAIALPNVSADYWLGIERYGSPSPDLKHAEPLAE